MAKEQNFIGRYPDFMVEGNPPCSTTDPEIYFPEKGGSSSTGREVRLAKSICRTCPYATPCTQWAIDNNELGIWGGLTERERRQLKRERRPIK